MSAYDAAQQQPMRRRDDAVEEAVSRQMVQAQRVVFEDVTTVEDAHLIIVSTCGDPISAKRISVRARTSKWLGHMSDQSLQTLSQNRVASSSTSTISTARKQLDKSNAEFFDTSWSGVYSLMWRFPRNAKHSNLGYSLFNSPMLRTPSYKCYRSPFSLTLYHVP
jgi:hypothetical protein